MTPKGRLQKPQIWLEFSVKCGYLAPEIGRELYQAYDLILGKLVNMSLRPEQWAVGRKTTNLTNKRRTFLVANVAH